MDPNRIGPPLINAVIIELLLVVLQYSEGQSRMCALYSVHIVLSRVECSKPHLIGHRKAYNSIYAPG